VHVRQATMRALLYAQFICWYDDIDTGEEVVSYYMLTAAGKVANTND
jgi:hypothetical protein